MEIHVPIKREYVNRSPCFFFSLTVFGSTLLYIRRLLHREGKDVERGMEGTVIAEGRGTKDGKERNKERKKVYLSLSRQTMLYGYYSKHI
jgi:hypothetical protein